jgi:hypothetical protein
MPTPGGPRPEVSVDFQGPLEAPRRKVDLSAFIGWLTLRSVERETRRLEEIQAKVPTKETDKEPSKDAKKEPGNNKDPGSVGSTPARSGREEDKLPDLPPAISVKPLATPKAARPRTLATPQAQ